MLCSFFVFCCDPILFWIIPNLFYWSDILSLLKKDILLCGPFDFLPISSGDWSKNLVIPLDWEYLCRACNQLYIFPLRMGPHKRFKSDQLHRQFSLGYRHRLFYVVGDSTLHHVRYVARSHPQWYLSDDLQCNVVCVSWLEEEMHYITSCGYITSAVDLYIPCGVKLCWEYPWTHIGWIFQLR